LHTQHAPVRRLAPAVLLLAGLLLASLFAFAAPARAQLVLDFSLNPSSQTGTQGDTLQFFGTITNPASNMDTLFLNGLSSSLVGPGLSVDDSPFFDAGFPRSLAPGASFTGRIFDVLIGANTPNGNYDGSITIQGGTDANAQADLATAAVSVAVVPEPSSLALLLGGGGVPAVPFLALLVRRRRCRRC